MVPLSAENAAFVTLTPSLARTATVGKGSLKWLRYGNEIEMGECALQRRDGGCCAEFMGVGSVTLSI